MDTLLIQLRPISDKYKLIGSIAGVSLDILNEIESHTAEPFDKLVEVCDYWLKQCRIDDIPLTWKAVADILTLIGQEQMSCGIMEVYATGMLFRTSYTFLMNRFVYIMFFMMFDGINSYS